MPDPELPDQALLLLAEREQQIFAQQLHDTLCQSLLGIALTAQSLARGKLAGKEVSLADLEKIRDQLDGAVEQSRTFLAPQILAEHPDQLPEQMGKLVRLYSPQVAGEFVSNLRGAMPAGSAAALLYRVARESLQNIVAGAQASRFKLHFESTGGLLKLAISHDGRACRADSTACILEGDGVLERMVVGAGMQWKMEPSGTALVVILEHDVKGVSRRRP